MSSMPPDDDARLRHLIEAAETAMPVVERRCRSDLDEDEMLRLALTVDPGRRAGTTRRFGRAS